MKLPGDAAEKLQETHLIAGHLRIFFNAESNLDLITSESAVKKRRHPHSRQAGGTRAERNAKR
jgi:hypothetical protein